MTGLDVHIALTPEQTEALRAADAPDDIMTLIDEIEEGTGEPDEMSSDKAWDAIHRCLSDGTLQHDSGAYPLSHAVLGGADIDAGDDYIVATPRPHRSVMSPSRSHRLSNFFAHAASTRRPVVFTVDQ